MKPSDYADCQDILSMTGFNEYSKDEWIYEIPSTERWVSIKIDIKSEIVQINFNDESNIVISPEALVKALFIAENF